jgi:hypothetical protein
MRRCPYDPAAVEMITHLRYDTMRIASAEAALGALAASRGAN